MNQKHKGKEKVFKLTKYGTIERQGYEFFSLMDSPPSQNTAIDPKLTNKDLVNLVMSQKVLQILNRQLHVRRLRDPNTKSRPERMQNTNNKSMFIGDHIQPQSFKAQAHFVYENTVDIKKWRKW